VRPIKRSTQTFWNGANMKSELSKARILGPTDGEYAGKPGLLHDRFLISGPETGGRFAAVEHLLPPRALAAPLHRHRNEDEYSFILEGTVGALLGGEEVFGTAGAVIFKPRDQWHTFWNAGDTPARILEIISPGGFEQAFRDLDELGGELSPEAVSVIGQRYSVDIDFNGTGPLAERHGLSM
jgi:mannose-6-phosphate isomerase-like protein (cupin superfamily)